MLNQSIHKRNTVFKASLKRRFKRRLSAKAVWTSGASHHLEFGSKARGSASRCSSPGESRGGASRKASGRHESRGGGGRDER
jgi:hypothetical protein